MGLGTTNKKISPTLSTLTPTLSRFDKIKFLHKNFQNKANQKISAKSIRPLKSGNRFKFLFRLLGHA